MMSSDSISLALANYYLECFEKFGAEPRGVGWGPDQRDHELRLDVLLEGISRASVGNPAPTLLDVGCGYGSLLDRAINREVGIDYSGIDMCEPMINEARKRHPNANWIVGDFMKEPVAGRYDFVVSNGVLTQKLEATSHEMDEFLKLFVAKMFDAARVGVAFNVMTSFVDFEEPNLYYREPSGLLNWCMTELSPKVILNCAYPLFEFTVFLYREDAPGFRYGDHRTT